MIYGRRIFAFVVVALFLVPLVARSDDIEDLKAALAANDAAFNAHNADAFVAGMHDEVTHFVQASPFPIVGKAAVRQLYQALFANAESLTLRRIDPQFRVIGATGVSWGYMTATVKPKDGPQRTVFTRYMWTFTKLDGKWIGVAVHLSYLPSGN